MEKVKVTKEQAEKIEELKAQFGTEKFYYDHIRNGKWTCACLNEIKPFEMARILIEGYEVVRTAVEEFNEELRSHIDTVKFYSRRRNLDRHEKEQERYSNGFVTGAHSLAKTYGITIEGVMNK